MPTKPLTAANIRAAKPGDILRDEEVAGLHLRIFPTKSVYSLSYKSPTQRKPNGKPVEPRLKLGHGNVLTIPEARRLAARALLDVANGIDPALSKRQSDAIPTLDQFFNRVYDGDETTPGYWNDKSDAWRKFVRAAWTTQISPRFGSRAITDALMDVEMWHAGYKTKRPFYGNRSIEVLSVVLNLAEKATYGRLRPLNSNPCGAITKHPEPKRKVYATPKQLLAIGALLNKYADAYPVGVAFLYMMLYSGSRPTLIERSTPELLTRMVIDGKPWGVLRRPGKATAKTGEDDVVWLPPLAMAVINRLPLTSGEPIAGKMPRKLWNKIRAEAECPHLRMGQDIRRTFATVGLSTGQTLDIIGRLYNHRTTQTTLTYAQLLDGEKQKTADAIAGSMDKLLKGVA